MIRELLTRPRMIKAYKTFVVLLLVLWAYVVIQWTSEQIAFHRAMGGMF